MGCYLAASTSTRPPQDPIVDDHRPAEKRPGRTPPPEAMEADTHDDARHPVEMIDLFAQAFFSMEHESQALQRELAARERGQPGEDEKASGSLLILIAALLALILLIDWILQ